jgi:anaerobic magnesium-protoporphyrin IX monomethyl ester cyclase
MKQALLIYPTEISEIPHSLALIAAILKEEGYRVDTIISTFKKPLTNDDFVAKARDVRPDLVGISMMTMQCLKVYDLIRRLKAMGLFVVVGGAHATDCPEEVVGHGADIAVRNEGEESIREIVHRKPLQDILGISYAVGLEPLRMIATNPPRPRLKDLTTLPNPDFSVFDLPLFELAGDGLVKGINRVYSSRGCPGKCTYCDWQVFGQKVSYHPVPELITEIQRRVDEYGITNFMIADDCFTTNRKHVEAFCEAIVNVRPKIIWQTSTRADFAEIGMMRMMAQAGCYMVSIGIESGDEETLRRIKKGVKLEDNYNAPVICAEAGLQVITNLMFGFPWETVAHLENTHRLIKAIWAATYMFQVSGAVIPFPGSQIYREFAEEYGFKDYWLKEKYQGCGVQLYQNALKPYAVSTFYHRNMYDDTYIAEDYFFKYPEAYKEKLWEVISDTGRHNLEMTFPGRPWKQATVMNLCKLSRWAYKRWPHLEKGIGGMIESRRRPPAEDTRNVKKGIIKH